MTTWRRRRGWGSRGAGSKRCSSRWIHLPCLCIHRPCLIIHRPCLRICLPYLLIHHPPALILVYFVLPQAVLRLKSRVNLNELVY
eukprot:633257-Prorocentrum_minimum.AAC.1